MGGRQYRASAEPRAVEPQTNAVPMWTIFATRRRNRSYNLS